MTILQTLNGTAKCPACHGYGDPTDWIPDPGIDPMMRHFICRSCRLNFYITARDGEQLLDIKDRVKALREMRMASEKLSKIH